MSEIEARGKSRYPGIRAFELNERNLFFGRAMETCKLYALVQAKPLVVLFSKSGIGKSSLLNAAVIPRLDHELYRSIRIRIQDVSQDPINTVKSELSKYLDPNKLAQFTNKNDASSSLWEYLRACDFTEGENYRIPILIFDQFEEFFLHRPQVRQELTDELADMVAERLPLAIRKKLRSIPFKDRSPELLAWCSPVPVKIIMAIRSDRLSLMDELTDEIPSILQNRFHLKPLLAEQAKAAILEPARLSGPGFLSPKFEYEALALQQILDSLVNHNLEVESFQLQLVCQHIENEIIDAAQRGQTPLVQPDLYDGKQGIDNILHDYYENALARLTATEEQKARVFIEEGLIVDGRRVGVNAGVEEKNFGIGAELLTKLLRSRLIRAEDTHLGRSYEISHDTLVEPILRSYERRMAEEAAAAAERERQQQAVLLMQERRKRRVAIFWAVLGFLLAFVATGAAIMAYRFYVEAEAQNRLSTASQLTANSILQSETFGDITKAIDQAERALDLVDSIPQRRALLKAAYKNIGPGRYLFYDEVFRDTTSEMNDMAFGADGSLALAYQDGAIRLLRLAQDDPPPRIPLSIGSLQKVFYNAPGDRLAVLGDGTAAALLNAEGEMLARLEHQETINDLGFTNDGRYLATVGMDKMVKVWSAEGDVLVELGGHQAGILGVQFSGDGQRLLTWGYDNLAIIWDWQNGVSLHELRHEGTVLCASFSPDGLWVATGDRERDLTVWRSNGERYKTLYGHEAEIRGLQFTRNSKNILSWDDTGLIKLRTILGEVIASIGSSHDSRLTVVRMADRDQVILSASEDNRAKVWTRRGKLIAICNGHELAVNQAVYDIQHPGIWTCSSDRTLRYWPLESRLARRSGAAGQGLTGVLPATTNQDLLVIRPTGVELLRSDGTLGYRLVGSEGLGISQAAFRPDGRQVVTGSRDGRLILWDSTGQRRATATQVGYIHQLDYSVDGAYFAAAVKDLDSLPIYDTTGQLVRNLATGPVQRVQFSPLRRRNLISVRGGRDQKSERLANLLLTVSEGRRLRLWNYETGEAYSAIDVEGADVLDVVFDRRGERIVAGCTDKTTRIWTIEGALLYEHGQQNASVHSVGVSQDGRYFISAAGDGSFLVRGFDGRLLVKGKGIDPVRPYAQFSYEDQYILTLDADNTVVQWPFAKDLILKFLEKKDR